MRSEAIFDQENLEQAVKDMEMSMSKNGFWDNQSGQDSVIQKYKRYKNLLDSYQDLRKKWEEIRELEEIISPRDPEFGELSQEIEALYRAVEELDIQLLFQGEDDPKSAIVTIHSGAGGTESQDWVQMLARLYTRFCERKGFSVRVTDTLEGEEVGLKHITFIAEGEYAYGYLKSERGVHRLIRISPFDSNRRRHTTFALVEVTPEWEDEIEVNIAPEELKIETFRASGRGGQHVNVTDSAVRIIHLPTGMVVQCQNERSQHQNKALALRVLKARLYEYYREEQSKKLMELKGEAKDIAWGSQIRTYVFHPYTMVKDHRTGHETGNIGRVMDGEIEDFIEAYLRKERNL
ncbi:MAG: peptide chain release factor 2 [Candidatus Atribacteria bacterium]|nr:peptide chain release factor 2 [Candidatus Atribacteria bacterium]